jgi:hypothetical protein
MALHIGHISPTPATFVAALPGIADCLTPTFRLKVKVQIDRASFKVLLSKGLGVSEIAREAEIARLTADCLKKEIEQQAPRG